MDMALARSKQAIAESKEQLRWSTSTRNQEKIINQYQERERTLLAQLDLSRANVKSAEGTRKLLQEHTIMLHDAQAKADSLQQSYNEMLTRQHHAEATIELQNGKLTELKDKWMVSHLKNRQLQEKADKLELQAKAMDKEILHKTKILNKYDEILFDSTARINQLRTENSTLKENVKHGKFLMEIIDKAVNKCNALKDQVIKKMTSPKADIRSATSNFFETEIIGEIDDLIDFVNNLQAVAESYNSKGFSREPGVSKEL